MGSSGISWAICKSARCSRQITVPAPHHSVFLQAECPSCRPTNSVNALKLIFIQYYIHSVLISTLIFISLPRACFRSVREWMEKKKAERMKEFRRQLRELRNAEKHPFQSSKTTTKQVWQPFDDNVSLWEKFHLVGLNILVQNSSKTTKKFFTFDVSTSIRGLHQKKLVLGLLLPVLGAIS